MGAETEEVLAALDELRTTVERSPDYQSLSDGTQADVQSWLDEIAAAVREGGAAASDVAQCGAYLGVYRGMDTISLNDADIRKAAARLDAKWKLWYEAGQTGSAS